jgi:hypothetical protein
MEIPRLSFRRAIYIAMMHTQQDEQRMGYTQDSSFLSSLKEILDKTDDQLFDGRIDRIDLV